MPDLKSTARRLRGVVGVPAMTSAVGISLATALMLGVHYEARACAAPQGRSATSPAYKKGVDDTEYGYTKESPVKVGGPEGLSGPASEQLYLVHLRDSRGRPFAVKRIGSVGAGPDGHVLDWFELTSSDGKTVRLYLDMYHPEVEPIAWEAPNGLLIRKRIERPPIRKPLELDFSEFFEKAQRDLVPPPLESPPSAKTPLLEIKGFRFHRVNAQGHREYLHEAAGVVFVHVPGGTFFMGSPPSEEGRGDNEERHEVTVTGFLIAKYELTYGQYRKGLGSTPLGAEHAELTVSSMTCSWRAASEWCERCGLSLPSEAQWEYACRGGAQTRFGFGDTPSTTLMVYAASPGSPREPRFYPVTACGPNGFGLHGMHGGVAELCDDVFDPTFYSKPAATEVNPVSKSGSSNRVVRGGHRFSPADECRSAARGSVDTKTMSNAVGFRPVFNLSPEK